MRSLIIKSTFIILFFSYLFTGLNAQDYGYRQQYEEEDELPSRIFLAPDFGLILGDITRIEFSPSLGYHITPRFIGGIGGRYEFVRERNFYSNRIDIRTSIYGYRLFTRLIVIDNIEDIIPIQIPLGIFGHMEFESLSLEEKYFRLGAPADATGRFWLNSVLAGFGINQQTGSRSSFNVMVLWDITNSASSPYVNPILKFGLQFYL